MRGMEPALAREQIGRFVGTWQSRSEQNFRGEHIVVEAIEEFSWLEPTRVWLVKHVSKEDHPIIGPMNGIDLWAYDAKIDGVVNYWFDNQSAEVFPHRGEWTDANTLTMTGMIVWEGREMRMKMCTSFETMITSSGPTTSRGIPIKILRFDASGAVLGVQELRVSIACKVFGQAVSVDTRGQSSFVVYDAKAEQITDVTASAIGAVEYWDEATPWDNEVLAFALRGKARFLIGDNPDQPVDFRKAYRVIGPAGYELAYYLSDDDGASWRKLSMRLLSVCLTRSSLDVVTDRRRGRRSKAGCNHTNDNTGSDATDRNLMTPLQKKRPVRTSGRSLDTDVDCRLAPASTPRRYDLVRPRVRD